MAEVKPELLDSAEFLSRERGVPAKPETVKVR